MNPHPALWPAGEGGPAHEPGERAAAGAHWCRRAGVLCLPALPAGSCVVCRADQRGAITATAQLGAAASPAAPARPRCAQVFMSAEVAPWSKTGGLGDVVGALPIELAKRGHNVITIAPRYDQYWDAWDTGGKSLLQS